MPIHTVLKTQDLNGHQLLRMFLAQDFKECSALSAPHYASTTVNYHYHRDDGQFILLFVYSHHKKKKKEK